MLHFHTPAGFNYIDTYMKNFVSSCLLYFFKYFKLKFRAVLFTASENSKLSLLGHADKRLKILIWQEKNEAKKLVPVKMPNTSNSFIDI